MQGAGREAVSAFLSEIGSRIGAPLGLDDNGVCGIRYGADLDCAVEVPASGDLVAFRAALAAAPAEGEAGREALFERLLAMNLDGAAGGCALALDRAEGDIMLCLSQPTAGLDQRGFENLLGNFIETAERLRGALAAAAEEAPAQPAAGDMLMNLRFRG